MTERIAVVGYGLHLPGAGADEGAFWANLAAGKDVSRDVPEGRWALPAERCLDPRVANPDTVYSTRGYYLDSFQPDLTGLALDQSLVRELDPLFHLVLDAGGRAWRSAKTAEIDRSRVGIVLGNICLPTSRSNALCREYLGGKLFDTIGSSRESHRTHPLNRFVAGLPAGLLAKGLELGGGSFTLDAACASSLYAVKLGMDELLAGRRDAMLVGGVNGSDCQYTQMGFAQLRALSTSGRCSPFDRRADGLMVGEGAALFVLKRLSDALRNGDQIHAIVAGVGLSNDMHGNLLAPAREGQLRAMRQAYARAAWQPGDVDYIECHATGTPVGDAVEFESLRELWGTTGWRPGYHAIGAVKSSVGHLLTGAGAAAIAKVLLAMRNATIPPQVNFESPADGLAYRAGPFRIPAKAEPWERRSDDTPRRAAVSGFGFGGVNAHLLLEEWIPSPASSHVPANFVIPELLTVESVKLAKASQAPQESHSEPKRDEAIAVVGMATHFGPWSNLREFQERVLGGDAREPQIKLNGWGLAEEKCPAGYFLEELTLPIDRFRIPPRELEETLPQQLIMLEVAAAALDDCRTTLTAPDSGDPATGVFIGLGLDPNTTNYHLRWSVLARQESNYGIADIASPPLSANRVMGALGSIAASRIARTFHFGGPAHTVCSEEASSARAIQLGVRALQAGEIDRAIVGGVELLADPRTLLPNGESGKLFGEGAAALVLKRLADAVRDGDRIYAVIDGIGASGADESRAIEQAGATDVRVFDAAHDIGFTGAASGAASLVKACLALYQEILPYSFATAANGATARYWLHHRESGPRQASVISTGADGSSVAILTHEYDKNAIESQTNTDRRQPLGARDEGLFVVESELRVELPAVLQKLKEFAATSLDRNIESLAREWFDVAPIDATRSSAVAFVSGSAADLLEQVAFAMKSLEADPHAPFPQDFRPAIRDRVFYSERPLGPKAKIAFVFPGSGNHFDGMGRVLGAQWPEILRTQMSENRLLRGQFAPEYFWDGFAGDAPHRDLMFGQVTLGALVADLLTSLGVVPAGMIGLSLGESAGLFGMRIWRDRDLMFRRMGESTLFRSDLAPPYHAARTFWGVPEDHQVDWVSGIVAASAEDVLAHLRPGLQAYLLIVNTPTECVIGGMRKDVEKLALALAKPLFLLDGVTLAHCEVGRPVEFAYRELHTLPVTPQRDLTIYSGAWGKSYVPTEAVAADSITAGLLQTIDFPAAIESAYRDGFRIFLEVGPGASCTRMISAILGDRQHLARAAQAARLEPVSQILRIFANLIVERIPVDLTALYGRESSCVGHRQAREDHSPVVIVPVGNRPSQWPVRELPTPPITKPTPPVHPRRDRVNAPQADPQLSNAIAGLCNVQTATMRAQETFLRVNQKLMESASSVIRFQTALLDYWKPVRAISSPEKAEPIESVPRALSFEQCCTFAIGKIGDVLGRRFAVIDGFPTRVRLPDGPLQLVDRILSIEGEPLSMTRGRVVTEHTVRADRWYLDNNRIPTAIAVEAGQADLFLAGFLGIDLQTRGLAVYRLLDAVVAFHRALPTVGETIRYDIRINEFTRQGDSWLFRFQFDGTVDGEPLITMRNGVAGFFTAQALAAGKGIIQTTLDRQKLPGTKPADWRDLVPQKVCSLDARQVQLLGEGKLAEALGPEFDDAWLRDPATLPGGMLQLVDRVPLIDPNGGRYGIGFVRAEFDIHPDDWFLICHFVDDRVMPGTLMYECCLHTLRIFLMRLGWVAEKGEGRCEPIPGIDSRLKCRGQVISTTLTVAYEVTIKEIGYGPAPFCIADALMYADGKPIVEITNMSLRMPDLSRTRLETIWSPMVDEPRIAMGEKTEELMIVLSDRMPREPLYDRSRILAFATGKPSEAFGEPYQIFDSSRVIARLPGPPFAFLDRVIAVSGEPFVMAGGASCIAEYDVPTDAWFFDANRTDRMPFSVLLEIALQPCGWLAAYCGSALTSSVDLSFRNLGGKATQFRAVDRHSGTLTIHSKLTNVSNSAGMIIQHYEMLVTDRIGKVYEGTTYFGFFAKEQLANQVGIREARVPWPSGLDVSRGFRGDLPHEAPFPDVKMRMIDRIEAFLPTGGAHALGLVVGRIDVDQAFWFFEAHFFQDPVWPGSLGLESFLQLLSFAAWKRWGNPPAGWQMPALNQPHSWTYRGQVVPKDKVVTVLVEVSAIDDSNQRITADGFLTVDGRVIYQMKDFGLDYCQV